MNKVARYLNPEHQETQSPTPLLAKNTFGHRNRRDQTLLLLKRAIWGYFLLLIFEGALRKWVLPGLSTPLLLIRDPLALWIMYMAWQKGIFPAASSIKIISFIGFIGILTALIFGHGNFPVAIYGARILLIHFPLMFVIGKVFTKTDVIEMGKILLWISIPMAVLVALQFYSPQTAWVNKGIGESAGGGFGGVMGFFRPPATFSFTNGTSLFFHLVACFVIFFWLNPKYVNKILLILSSGALIASIPLSISRTLLFTIMISLVFAVIAISRNPKYLSKMIIAGFVLFIAVFLISQLSFFQTASLAFTNRFETAGDQEGGLEGALVDRYLGGLLAALMQSTKQPFFGHGIGLGTNVGSQLITGGVSYLISEGEWGRMIGELGPVMGLTVVFVRLELSLRFFKNGYQRLVKGDILPWMLISFGLLIIPQGQWAQPTALGFSTLIGGLIFASFKDEVYNIKQVNSGNI